jgi:hypothetical protein
VPVSVRDRIARLSRVKDGDPSSVKVMQRIFEHMTTVELVG